MPVNYSCFVCIFSGWLSGEIKKGFDSDGAVVVQGALQDPSIIRSRKAEGPSVHGIYPSADVAYPTGIITTSFRRHVGGTA